MIIQWIWATQTYYDIRFQAEDVVHRVYKAAQICLFVYIGAAGGNWDLSKIRDPDSIPNIASDRYEEHCEFDLLLVHLEEGVDDFSTRCGEFHNCLSGFHCLEGAFGYSVSDECVETVSIRLTIGAILARQANRKIGLQISSAIILIISMVLIVVALALPTTSTALRGAKVSPHA